VADNFDKKILLKMGINQFMDCKDYRNQAIQPKTRLDRLDGQPKTRLDRLDRQPKTRLESLKPGWTAKTRSVI